MFLRPDIFTLSAGKFFTLWFERFVQRKTQCEALCRSRRYLVARLEFFVLVDSLNSQNRTGSVTKDSVVRWKCSAAFTNIEWGTWVFSLAFYTSGCVKSEYFISCFAFHVCLHVSSSFLCLWNTFCSCCSQNVLRNIYCILKKKNPQKSHGHLQ